MTTSSIIIILVLLLISFVIFRVIKTGKKTQKLNADRFEKIKPIYEKLESGQAVTHEDIFPYAKSYETREACFSLLKEHNKSELFPKEFYSIVMAAESNLANWLVFPTELDAYPKEMEHVKRVTLDFDGKNNYVHYEVFKCRVDEPHWAAKDGWFFGVVGPYFDDSKPFDFPGSTFCRINSTVDKISPDDEAKWVHENISLRR